MVSWVSCEYQGKFWAEAKTIMQPSAQPRPQGFSLFRGGGHEEWTSLPSVSSPGAGQFSVDAVRQEKRGRGGRWLGSESHNANRSANYQSHNAKCTTHDQGAMPGDEAVQPWCSGSSRLLLTKASKASFFILNKENSLLK